MFGNTMGTETENLNDLVSTSALQMVLGGPGRSPRCWRSVWG